MKLKKKHSIIKKYKISIQRMRIKFERKKQMKGWVILNWRAKLKIKINFTKE